MVTPSKLRPERSASSASTHQRAGSVASTRASALSPLSSTPTVLFTSGFPMVRTITTSTTACSDTSPPKTESMLVRSRSAPATPLPATTPKTATPRTQRRSSTGHRKRQPSPLKVQSSRRPARRKQQRPLPSRRRQIGSLLSRRLPPSSPPRNRPPGGLSIRLVSIWSSEQHRYCG